MRRSNKHEVKIMQFRDFTGGVNQVLSAENIADNELVEGENIECDHITGETRTRNGIGSPIETFANDIRKGWHHKKTNMHYIVSGTHLYQYNNDVKRDLGVLSGSKIPSFCEYDNKILVASGGKLQYVEGSIFTTIDSSPSCDIVFERFGRVVIAKSGDDYLYYSAVGDVTSETAWTNDSDDPSSSQVLEVGYKDNCDIIAIEPMMQDLIVYKTHKIYRVISEYPDWQVLEISRNASLANKECTLHLGNNVIFLDRNNGMQELVAVQEYGDIHPREMLYKISPWIRNSINSSEARIWHLKSTKQVIIKPENTDLVAVYHYITGGVTFWRFDKPITDIIETDDKIIILQDKSLYYMHRDNEKDNDEYVASKIKTKKFIDYQGYLIKRITVILNEKTTGVFSVSCGELTTQFKFKRYAIPIYYNTDEIRYNIDYIKQKYIGIKFVLVYDNDDKVFGNSNQVVSVIDFKVRKHQQYRTDYIQFEIKVDRGTLSWGNMLVEFAGVGV